MYEIWLFSMWVKPVLGTMRLFRKAICPLFVSFITQYWNTIHKQPTFKMPISRGGGGGGKEQISLQIDWLLLLQFLI